MSVIVPKISSLPNGVRVISDHMPHVETASIGVWVDVGARYETLPLNGISHLLEHMAFKGTKTRSARQIAEEIEAVGGALNAYTSREHTTYFAKVMKDDIGLATSLLADILNNSIFDETELVREKDVIIQEIGQANDTPDDIVFDMLQEIAFPNQSLGRSILGSVASVSALSSDDIRTFLNRHYCGDTIVVTAAGNVDHDYLVSLIENAFGHLPKERGVTLEPGQYVGGDIRKERALEQLHLTLGFPSLPFSDPDYYALQVYTTILGGGMSSRLFQEIRETRGLAYSVYAFSSSHTDTGLFGIYAGTQPKLAGELVPVIAREMKQMITNIDVVEIDRAKAQLKAGLLMSLESTSARIEQMGRQMLLFDRLIPVDEIIAQIDAIDTAAIRRVGERTLSGKYSLASIGANSALPEIDEVEALFQAT